MSPVFGNNNDGKSNYPQYFTTTGRALATKKQNKRECYFTNNIIRMTKNTYVAYLIVLGGIITGCKKPYNPSVVSSPNHYLVADGVIDVGDSVTVIKLSETVNLGDNVKTSGLTGYTVNIQNESGANVAELKEVSSSNGKYASSAVLSLDLSKKYRLHISGNGKEYASDYIAVKKTPPIDSIGFVPKGSNLNIYVNTHDATNSTRYYRWDYTEAWKFHARYESGFIVDSVTKGIRARTENEASYYCYTGDASSNTVITSSAKLTSDVIFQAPVTIMPSTAEKISIRYSILLKQYALTKEAYEFWENIRKNTEQLGSIFDAQPSQLQGNLHCISNPAEPVIGFITITNVQRKRIFINNSQLPAEWYPVYPYSCEADTALLYNPKNMQHEAQSIIIDGNGIPISAIVNMNVLIGYTYSTIECADCRIRGKSLPPPFWKP